MEGGFGKTVTEVESEKHCLIDVPKQNEVEHMGNTVINAKKIHARSEKDVKNELEYKTTWWATKLKRNELPTSFFKSTEGESERKLFFRCTAEQYAFRYNGKVM